MDLKKYKEPVGNFLSFTSKIFTSPYFLPTTARMWEKENLREDRRKFGEMDRAYESPLPYLEEVRIPSNEVIITRGLVGCIIGSALNFGLEDLFGIFEESKKDQLLMALSLGAVTNGLSTLYELIRNRKEKTRQKEGIDLLRPYMEMLEEKERELKRKKGEEK